VNITLIGYRGTGKSTVARLVADRLGWSWVDADACVEEHANRTIREIFAAEGEAGFRDRESALLSELTGRDHTVIATGGGAVLRPENRRCIRRCGFTAWLVASPSTIQQRISQDSSSASRRPPLTNHGSLGEICQLLSDRAPLYRECADLILDTDRLSPDEVAQQIVQAVSVKEPSTRKE
jgi:shikimate kinase